MKYILLSTLLVCSAPCAFAQVPAYFPAAGLKSAHLFSGNAADSSGLGNHGTVNGATLTTDRFGKANNAYHFNGVNNNIDIPSSSSLDFKNQSFSMSAWIKTSNYNPSSEKVIAWRGHAPSYYDPYLIYFSGGQIKFRRDVGSGFTTNEVGFSTAGIDASKWHLVVATYSYETFTMSIYFDGVLKQQQLTPGTINYATNTFTNMIGDAIGGTATAFSGDLDELGLWDRVLTPCEISRLYYSSASFITAGPSPYVATQSTTASFTINELTPGSSYQWQVNTGSGFTNVPASAPYTGTTAKTLTIQPATTTMTGYQYRCIRNGQSCPDTSTAAQLLVWPTSIENIDNNGAQVHPNPATSQLFVSGLKNANYSITNVLGSTVAEGQLNGNAVININALPAGSYVLHLTVDKTTKQIKFIKE